MKNKLILGVVVLAVVLGGLFFLGVISVDANDPTMDITFYDVDGKELGAISTTSLSLFGIRRAGFEGDIHSLEVVVYFTVTTDIEYVGVDTRCWLEVVTTLNTITGGHVHTVAEHRLGPPNTDLEGTFYNTYLMSDLLPASAIEATGKANGWNMKFNARLETLIGLPDGTTRSVDDTCGLGLALTWVEGLELESHVALP